MTGGLASGSEPHTRDVGATSPPDGAAREIIRLLGVVAGEEQALARLDRSVAELQGIAAARAALAGCTRLELSEAHGWACRPERAAPAPMLPTDGVEGSW